MPRRGDYHRHPSSLPPSHPHSSSRRHERRSRSPSRTRRDHDTRGRDAYDSRRSSRRSRSRSRSPHVSSRRSRSPHRSSRQHRSRSPQYRDTRGRSSHQPSRRSPDRSYDSRHRRSRSRSPRRSDRSQTYRARSPRPKQSDQPPRPQTEKWRYCLLCHSPHTWTKECRNDGTQKDAEPAACIQLIKDGLCPLAEEVWEGIRNLQIPDVDALIPHLYYGVQKLNFYRSFVTRRDKILLQIAKHGFVNEHVDPTRYPLASVKDISVFEAYASASCKLAHTLMRNCADALITLFEKGVANVVGYQPSKDPNVKLSKQDLVARVADRLAARVRSLDANEMNIEPESLPNNVIGNYNSTVDKALQVYTQQMDGLYREWKELAKSKKVWKRQLTPGQEVFEDLPFDQFRVSIESAENTSLPILVFAMVQNLDKYVETKAQHIKAENRSPSAPPAPATIPVQEVAELKKQFEEMKQLLLARTAPVGAQPNASKFSPSGPAYPPAYGDIPQTQGYPPRGQQHLNPRAQTFQSTLVEQDTSTKLAEQARLHDEQVRRLRQENLDAQKHRDQELESMKEQLIAAQNEANRLQELERSVQEHADAEDLKRQEDERLAQEHEAAEEQKRQNRASNGATRAYATQEIDKRSRARKQKAEAAAERNRVARVLKERKGTGIAPEAQLPPDWLADQQLNEAADLATIPELPAVTAEEEEDLIDYSDDDMQVDP